MSNIQKLYELAGVQKKIMCDWTCKGSGLCMSKCEHYKSNQVHYPPFTDSKQLELIKWFVKTFAEIETLEINYCLNDCFQISSCNSVSKFEFGFEEALASFIFNLYLDLTDNQKEEIKRILE